MKNTELEFDNKYYRIKEYNFCNMKVFMPQFDMGVLDEEQTIDYYRGEYNDGNWVYLTHGSNTMAAAKQVCYDLRAKTYINKVIIHEL